jgi:DNA-binding CsgD family transcriptional regulator
MVTDETTGIEDLVRILLKHSSTTVEQNNERRPDGQTEEIILDLDVDGQRYLLVRMPKATHLPVQLTPREREIVRLVAEGHSNKIIADVLSISSWTVCTHLRRVFAKLGVGSRAAMVAHVAKTARTGSGDWAGGTADAREAGLPAHSSHSQVHDIENLTPSFRLASPSFSHRP